MRTTTVTDTTCPNCGTFTPKDTEPHWDSNDCIAALRTELDAAQTRCDEHERDAGYWHYRALRTEAELAALQAAQQWRPGSETPPAPDWYQAADIDIGVYDLWYSGSEWHKSSFQGVTYRTPPLAAPDYWRPIPPLPPAPDEVQP